MIRLDQETTRYSNLCCSHHNSHHNPPSLVTMEFVQYNPTAPKQKKRPRIPQENIAPLDNPAKRPRVSSASNIMTATPVTHGLVDIHARLSPSACMDLALKVLDVGNLSVAGLLMYWLTSVGTSRFKNAFLSEGGGLEIFLKELVEQHLVAEDCISRAVGHGITLKMVSAEMELVKSYTLLSSTEVTPHSMRDWTIGIPEHLAPCLSSILRVSAVSNRAAKENKAKKDTFTVSILTLLALVVRITQTNLVIDYQRYYSPTRKLWVSKLTTVPSTVRSLTPCSRHSLRGNQHA